MKPAERMKIPRQSMPEQEPEVRARNFSEVNLGMALEVARKEADRCLRCKDAKCVPGCPVDVDIAGFISAIADGDMPRAADIMYDANVLPGGSARRKHSARRCASAPRRARRWRSGIWSAS